MDSRPISIAFYKGDNFDKYEPGGVYFEESSHLIKVGINETEAASYSGVKSAYQDTDGSIVIVNENNESFKLDYSNLISLEEFTPVESAAYGAIQSGTLGTINGQSIEGGNNIEIDMDIYILSPDGLPTENIQTNKIYIVPVAKANNETEFAEYGYVNNKWVQFGSHKATVDLSAYMKTADADKKYMIKGTQTSGSSSSSSDAPALSISTTGAFNNYGDNAQAFNAVRKVTNYNGPTGSGYPLNAASFGVKMDGTTAFSHKKYETFNKETGAYTGAKNTAVLVFSGRSGLLYAKNTGSGNDVTDDMYKRVGVIDSPDEEQRCYSAKQVDDLISPLIARIEALEEMLKNS